MRIVWNDNNWETPIKKRHNPSLWKDGKNNASFENSFGFGGEDWLFNSRYNINGYQYGYIRGVEHLSDDLEFIDELYLYTIDSYSKKRLLVAKINNVEVIEGYNEVQSIISPVLKKFKEQRIEELKAVDAYYKALDIFELQSNVRFKPADINFFGYLNEIEQLNKSSFYRFTPYKVDDELEQILLKNILSSVIFTFKKGKSKPIKSHTRTMGLSNCVNLRAHTDISEDLYDYLHKVLEISKDFISIENSRVSGRIIDGTIIDSNKYTFFEIKTHSYALANIRDAIGQLLEYSHLDPKIKIEKLVIIGPAIMNKFEEEYLNRIRNSIKLKLEYWAYMVNEKQLKSKFRIYK